MLVAAKSAPAFAPSVSLKLEVEHRECVNRQGLDTVE